MNDPQQGSPLGNYRTGIEMLTDIGTALYRRLWSLDHHTPWGGNSCCTWIITHAGMDEVVGSRPCEQNRTRIATRNGSCPNELAAHSRACTTTLSYTMPSNNIKSRFQSPPPQPCSPHTPVLHWSVRICMEIWNRISDTITRLAYCAVHFRSQWFLTRLRGSRITRGMDKRERGGGGWLYK